VQLHSRICRKRQHLEEHSLDRFFSETVVATQVNRFIPLYPVDAPPSWWLERSDCFGRAIETHFHKFLASNRLLWVKKCPVEGRPVADALNSLFEPVHPRFFEEGSNVRNGLKADIRPIV
jgi:hypothetical protein